MQANTVQSSTPRSVSLRGVGLRALLVTFGSLENFLLRVVLANFGFLKNTRNFSKYRHIDPNFPGNGYFRFSKIKKISLTPRSVYQFWICGYFNFRLHACAESDYTLANTARSFLQIQYLCEK